MNKQYYTCTDFNELDRKTRLVEHSSKETALRAWPKLRRIYNKLHKYSLWIEDKYGNIIKKIDSTGKEVGPFVPTVEQAMKALSYLGDNPKLEIFCVDNEFYRARVVSGPQEMPWCEDKQAHVAIYNAMKQWDNRV